MEPRRILIVDGDKTNREILSTLLAKMDCEPVEARSAEEALPLLTGAAVAVVLMDHVLPEMDGFRLLSEIKNASPATEVVLMTRHVSVDTAVKAIRMGAYDYLRKPFLDLDEVWITVQRAVEKNTLTLKNRRLVHDLEMRNRELSAAVKRLSSLVEAGRAMSGIEGVPELLDFFIGLVVAELDVDRASLMLLDEKGDEMTIAASRGISEEVVRTVRVKVGEGIAGWVAQKGKPVVVKDAREDPRFKDLVIPHLSGSFISSPVVLSIPIKAMERVLGVINVTRKRDGGQFTDDDMGYVYGLAGQAAVALERAKHLGELQRACEALKETQDQLVATERLKALGQLAAGVAHDFNNILMGILGRSQLLIGALGRPQADLQAVSAEVRLIEQISLQGAETVRRIQDFTRIRRDIPDEAVDVNGIVRDVVEMTRPKWEAECQSRGVTLDVRMDLGELPTTAGNAHELLSVMHNLLFNAVEAMPRGGTLTFTTRHKSGWIHLEVSDTGSGMSDEVKSRIFEPFFTTKDAGQGMGLSIVYGIVARYGGSVGVKSKEGEGSVFIVNLPVLPVRSPRGRAAETAAGVDAHGPARILIVEDDELNRKLFQTALSVAGHDVSAAATGSEGLAMFRRGGFDLVLTDLSMPGMSGWDVAKEAKTVDPEVPVILMSGWAIQQEEEAVKEAGVDHVLSKPCSMETLRTTVRTALLGRKPEG